LGSHHPVVTYMLVHTASVLKTKLYPLTLGKGTGWALKWPENQVGSGVSL